MRHIQSWEVCCLVWENIILHEDNAHNVSHRVTSSPIVPHHDLGSVQWSEMVPAHARRFENRGCATQHTKQPQHIRLHTTNQPLTRDITNDNRNPRRASAGCPYTVCWKDVAITFRLALSRAVADVEYYY
eukprot:3411054-Rhodomonas_salina.2